jgi:hypothetical protein
MDQRSLARETPARTRRRHLRAALGCAVGLVVFAELSAQPALLRVERTGDRLRLAAPQLHFLAGPALDRLHDGRAVTYVLSATIEVDRGDPRSTRQTRHVVFSYDLWEERFSATQLDEPRRSASRLSASAAEAWSLDLFELPVRGAPADKTFVVKFECWLREDRAPPADAPAATTLPVLSEWFSRTAREAPPRWEAVSPRLRLADVKDRTSK